MKCHHIIILVSVSPMLIFLLTTKEKVYTTNNISSNDWSLLTVVDCNGFGYISMFNEMIVSFKRFHRNQPCVVITYNTNFMCISMILKMGCEFHTVVTRTLALINNFNGDKNVMLGTMARILEIPNLPNPHYHYLYVDSDTHFCKKVPSLNTKSIKIGPEVDPNDIWTLNSGVMFINHNFIIKNIDKVHRYLLERNFQFEFWDQDLLAWLFHTELDRSLDTSLNWKGYYKGMLSPIILHWHAIKRPNYYAIKRCLAIPVANREECVKNNTKAYMLWDEHIYDKFNEYISNC